MLHDAAYVLPGVLALAYTALYVWNNEIYPRLPRRLRHAIQFFLHPELHSG